MAALFWMITCLLSWPCTVLPEMIDLPPPMDLRLTSYNFIHILIWQRGAGTPPGVTYSVRVVPETETSWRLVPGCEAVVDPLICDLTEAFPDPSLVYLTAVRAELQTHSPASVLRFKPIRDTTLDPPLLSMAPCDRHLCVQLRSPLEHLRHIYEHLTYRLSISRDSTFQFFKDSVSLRDVVLDDVVLAPGRRYCVSVCVSDSGELQQSNYSRPVCVDTPGTFNTDVFVSVLLCLLVLGAVLSVALLVVAGFICLKRRPFPSALTSLRHIDEVLIIATPCASTFSPLYDVQTTAPPTGDKRSRSSSSSSSLSEGEVEGATQRGGSVYLSKGGENFSSSSVPTPSSSPCFSHLSPNPVTLLPHPPQAVDSGKTAPPTGEQTINTADCAPPKQSLEEEGGGLDVDLFTLTFGRQQEEGEEEEEEEECSPIMAPPSQRETDKEEEEEEEEDLCEYIRH